MELFAFGATHHLLYHIPLFFGYGAHHIKLTGTLQPFATVDSYYIAVYISRVIGNEVSSQVAKLLVFAHTAQRHLFHQIIFFAELARY